ncbi:MalY/PatB family protein [Albidovulum sp.]|uniref:MalY/PatB family protein n=1 Tax=Albidovulum sp. TaxID=1872424 RepID=UPI0039B90A9E
MTNSAIARSPDCSQDDTRNLFDEVIDRKKTNSMKWACGEKFLSPEALAADPLPMWVADMDFRAPQVVRDALHGAVEFGVFGYPGGATKSYLAAVASWQARRFGWEVPHDWIVQSAGVLTALKVAVQAFSAPGDTVLIQPPVYGHFYGDITMNGRHLAFAPLQLDGDRYRFNAGAFEAAIAANTKIFILSNPHNPTGNVWSEDELRAMGEICARHGVLVIADEIHQDFILSQTKRHIPFASLSDAFAQNSITCTAPSKTFNLAGLQSANLFIPNKRLREEFLRQYDRNLFPLVNSLGMVAAEAAYAQGEPWLEAMLAYLRDSHAHLAALVHALTPKIRVMPTDSLYLAWLDCRGMAMEPAALNHFMLTKARLWLNPGPSFGTEGAGFMRMNLGCPRATVDEAISRLGTALSAQ